MIDVLHYMIPTPAFVANKHLEATREGGHPMFNYWKDSWLWHIKSRAGFPWDGNFVDSNYIYQVFTEGKAGWQTPDSYKSFISQSWPKGRGGIAWAPRFYDPDDPNPVILITADTTYEEWDNGNMIATRTLGGPAVCMVRGPYQIEVGNLGKKNCIVQTYQWDRDLAHMETNYYALGFGWVRWELSMLKAGRYVPMQETLFDEVADGGSPELVLPKTIQI